MKKFLKNNKEHFVSAALVLVFITIAFIGYALYNAPGSNLEEKFVYLLKSYGYVILFIWSIMEGETGLVMAGVLSHTGDMNIFMAILVAGLGGFVGDQIYFYMGRFNKKFIHKQLISQRRKFALAHLLLKKYGWPVIFLQRYLYGMRTIIPMAIGLTRYDAKMFAIINFISAMVWAAITITLAYIFGEEILNIINWAKHHWYYALPLAIVIGGSIYYYFHKATKPKEKR